MEAMRLRPINKRFEQLIREHGSVWSVVNREAWVICFAGPGVFIVSANGRHSRWVKPEQLEAL